MKFFYNQSEHRVESEDGSVWIARFLQGRDFAPVFVIYLKGKYFGFSEGYLKEDIKSYKDKTKSPPEKTWVVERFVNYACVHVSGKEGGVEKRNFPVHSKFDSWEEQEEVISTIKEALGWWSGYPSSKQDPSRVCFAERLEEQLHNGELIK